MLEGTQGSFSLRAEREQPEEGLAIANWQTIFQQLQRGLVCPLQVGKREDNRAFPAGVLDPSANCQEEPLLQSLTIQMLDPFLIGFFQRQTKERRQVGIVFIEILSPDRLGALSQRIPL